METYLTIDEVAKYLNYADKTIRKWVFNRQIPFHKIHKTIRFRLSEIEKWIDNNGAQAELTINNEQLTMRNEELGMRNNKEQIAGSNEQRNEELTINNEQLTMSNEEGSFSETEAGEMSNEE